MKNAFALGCALLGMIAAAPIASASPVAVANASFEALVLPCAPGPSCFVLSDIPDWATSGQTATFSPSTGAGGEFASIPDGINVAAVGDGNGAGSISQALAATVAANTHCTLTVSVGARSDFPFSQYTVALEAGGTVLASDSSLNPAAGSFASDAISFFSGSSPATLGEQLTILLSATGTTAAGAGAQADFDAVALDTSSSTSVSEPTAIGMLGVGLCALMLVRRRTPQR
jgi:hypothetical protein